MTESVSAWKRCDFCQHQFQSEERYPLCPRGCRQPIERSGDIKGRSTCRSIPPPKLEPKQEKRSARVVTEEEKRERFRKHGLHPGTAKKPKAEEPKKPEEVQEPVREPESPKEPEPEKPPQNSSQEPPKREPSKQEPSKAEEPQPEPPKEPVREPEPEKPKAGQQQAAKGKGDPKY